MSVSKKFTIKKYKRELYQSFKSLSLKFSDYYPVNYVFNNLEIFEDIYRGSSGVDFASKLIIDDAGSVVGFRGAIPAKVQIPLSGGEYEIVESVSLTGWLLDPDRDDVAGLGSKLNLSYFSEYAVVTGVSTGQFAEKMFEVAGGCSDPGMRRWVIPLESAGYLALCGSNHEAVDAVLRSCSTATATDSVEKPNFEITDVELAALWERVSSFRPILGTYRDAAYWKWRYLNCSYYEYLVFGDPDDSGVIIGRLDTVVDEGMSAVSGLKVFRIIELLPNTSAAWNGLLDESFEVLLRATLAWARGAGAVAADFHMSTDLFNQLLTNVGFLTQNHQYGPPEASLAGLFRPFRLRPSLINFAWSVNQKLISKKMADQFEVYLVKSDGAGDRPKIWPDYE